MAERRTTPAVTGTAPVTDQGPSLVLVGHGSHLNPDSSAPVRACADRLRDRWTGPVRTAFWKETPSLRAVPRTAPDERAVVVPVMTSGGYFVDEVFPRELGLDAGRSASAPERPSWPGVDTAVAYADPVGTHEALTDVVREHAADVTDGAAPAPEFALALVGHGTERDPNSAAATRDHAERLREHGAFGEVRALFMDEPPNVEDLGEHVDADRIVVVPLFVANGYHVTEDIPRDLGLAMDDDGWPVPATVDGKRVWYADAVGTHPSLVDVVAARAEEAAALFDQPRADEPRSAPDDDGPADDAEPAHRAFRAWLCDGEAPGANAAFDGVAVGTNATLDGDAAGTDAPLDDEDAGPAPTGPTRQWGQLRVTVTSDGEYALRHVDDSATPAPDLASLADHDDLRDRVRFDDRGRYRPLPGAATLPTGWRLTGLDFDGLVRAVGQVYPTSILDWHRERAGDLEVTDYDAAAGRQTGIYADVDDLGGEELAAAVAACCGACTRRRTWEAGDGQALDAVSGRGEAPCREPCSFLLAAARAFLAVEKALADGDLADADREVDHAVRPGDVDEPGNVYRARYVAARSGDDDLGGVEP